MNLPVFFHVYFTWPTLVVAAGMVAEFVYISLYAGAWDRPTNEVILIALLTFEVWFIPYVTLPILFLISERLPWNKKTVSLWNGEGMKGLVIAIFVFSIVPGTLTYLGFLSATEKAALFDQIVTALALGLIGPAVFMAGVSLMIFFPGEGER